MKMGLTMVFCTLTFCVGVGAGYFGHAGWPNLPFGTLMVQGIALILAEAAVDYSE